MKEINQACNDRPTGTPLGERVSVIHSKSHQHHHQIRSDHLNPLVPKCLALQFASPSASQSVIQSSTTSDLCVGKEHPSETGSMDDDEKEDQRQHKQRLVILSPFVSCPCPSIASCISQENPFMFLLLWICKLDTKLEAQSTIGLMDWVYNHNGLNDGCEIRITRPFMMWPCEY